MFTGTDNLYINEIDYTTTRLFVDGKNTIRPIKIHELKTTLNPPTIQNSCCYKKLIEMKIVLKNEYHFQKRDASL